MNDRGQIFIIAAFITIGIVIGLTTVTNYAIVGDSKKQFFDLSDEIEFETKQVIDYGLYKNHDTAQLVANFLSDYADYISKNKVIFIYGNSTNISALSFQQQSVGGIDLNIGGGAPTNISFNEQSQSQAQVTSDTGGKVNVTIDSIAYNFDLREGQNFFFILIDENKGERFVSTTRESSLDKRIEIK